MINKVHIFGASGTGTTTLGKALTDKLNYKFYDVDDFYWLPTNPPFIQKRERSERQELLGRELYNNEKWIISGAICEWGDIFIPLFDLVVFLWKPIDIRIARITERETKKYGTEINPGGKRHESFMDFINWAKQYDTGEPNMRSLAQHEEWMKKITCPVIRIEEDLSLEDTVELVLKYINQ